MTLWSTLHPRVTFIQLPPNTVSLIPPLEQGEQGAIASFKSYHSHHTFCLAVKVSDESEKTLKQLWKDYNIFKAIKKKHWIWLREPLPTVCSQFSWIWKGRWGVQKLFSNSGTLSEKMELDMQEDEFTELLAAPHKEFTNEALLELEPQRKDEERQEGKESKWRDSWLKKWRGEFLYLRRHSLLLRHRTRT